MAEQKEKNFGLTVGMRLELLSEFHVFLFNGMLSKIDEDAIWVTNAAGGDVPPIIYNSNIRLRGIHKDSSTVMLYGTIRGSSSLFWKIGQLSKHSFYNKRNHYRHSVSIETTATRLADGLEETDDAHRLAAQSEMCRVLNISGGGLMFSSDRRFPLNTNIQMGDIILRPDNAAFSLKCRILRVTDNDSRYFHGCQFVDLNNKEQERLIREIFLLQGEEIRQRNNR